MRPQDGYISLIINPKSGASSNKLTVKKFIDYLHQKGFETKVNNTESLAHAQSLAAEAAVKYDCAMVMAAGGDGTIREVAHGLEGSDKPLMLLPCGTENLLACELGCRGTVKNLIEVFEAQIHRPFDLCKSDGRFFTSVGGVGIDGDVVKLVDKHRNGNITHRSYFSPIWNTFWNYDFPKVTIEVDDKIVFSDRGIAIFGNISRYSLGIPVLYLADVSDGLLDLCIYKCTNKIDLVRLTFMTILKSHRRSKNVIYKQGKKIKIYSDSVLNTELDGDPGPPLPLEVTIIPQAVKILVPPNAKPIGMRTRMFKIFG
ncbi:MAG: diacylglycerol kinase family lipid kinase [Sedimentisphaerales bacterium]|nr:diacylglycerol kinase family lipid kinase [Sedimentisphaerales bacterium]